jgi:hypothetical protein
VSNPAANTARNALSPDCDGPKRIDAAPNVNASGASPEVCHFCQYPIDQSTAHNGIRLQGFLPNTFRGPTARVGPFLLRALARLHHVSAKFLFCTISAQTSAQ